MTVHGNSSLSEVFEHCTIALSALNTIKAFAVLLKTDPKYRIAETYPKDSATSFLFADFVPPPSTVGFHRPALHAIAHPATPTAHIARILRLFLTKGRTLPWSSGSTDTFAGVTVELRGFWDTEDRLLEPGSPISTCAPASNG